jgi:hypothetical protein
MTYEPMEGVLVVLQDHARWIGTYGEMIRSDLHGAEIPQMDVATPTRGERDVRDLHKGKGRTFH